MDNNLNLKDIFYSSDAPFKLYVKDRFVCFSPERFVKIEDNKIRLRGIDDADKQIPNLDSLRGKVSEEGIYSSDVVLVPLEDGDRTEALVNMGKKVISIDLNPLSRTARKSTITIVDELTRCIPLLTKYIKEYKKIDKQELRKIIDEYDNKENLKEMLNYISNRLKNKDLEF